MDSRTRRVAPLARLALRGAVALALCVPAFAQAAPAAGSAPADDTPSVKVGGTLFADFTYQTAPQGSNSEGTYKPSSFNLTRAYINVTGNLSHRISFRFTPDIKQETKADADVKGSYVFRTKYAYGQFSLEDWFPKGSWVRLGVQPTPYPGYMDDIYRYRFQGSAFTDREKLLGTADTGVSAQFSFPGSYGDVHFGLFNGETYTGAETSDQKAYQIRAAFRPVPASPALKGLRFAAFADLDHYIRDAVKRRLVGAVTFEHARVNAGIEYLEAKDQDPDRKFPVSLVQSTVVDSKGWSAWVTPKLGKGFELLLRHDDYEPDETRDATKTRSIAGVAYWPRLQKGVTAAVLLDYEGTTYDKYASVVSDPTKLPKDEKKWALHVQLNF
ncbi:MAG: OprO/OprP family phosphate-selective porin [Acidobacteriia bacterium]|nr:OprO/OprP family phosphate-selective porin [Terriglobia bacterium]